MKNILFFLLLLFVGLEPAVAQDSLSVRLESTWISDGLLEVVVRLDSEADSLHVPLTSFQFDVVSSEEWTYLDVVTKATLSASTGWTTATNKANQRVAGFSSSLDAITVPGALIAMHFRLQSKKKGSKICLTAVRLNSGNPTPVPAEPCISW